MKWFVGYNWSNFVQQNDANNQIAVDIIKRINYDRISNKCAVFSIIFSSTLVFIEVISMCCWETGQIKISFELVWIKISADILAGIVLWTTLLLYTCKCIDLSYKFSTIYFSAYPITFAFEIYVMRCDCGWKSPLFSISITMSLHKRNAIRNSSNNKVHNFWKIVDFSIELTWSRLILRLKMIFFFISELEILQYFYFAVAPIKSRYMLAVDIPTNYFFRAVDFFLLWHAFWKWREI